MPRLQFCVNKRSIVLFIALAGLRLMAAVPLTNADNFWVPVTDAERQMKTPLVDKSAGVEAIFTRIHVMDTSFGDDVQRITVHYVRLKIFTEQGKDKASTLEIPYDEKTSIVYVAGRTIKPDGTVLELSKDAVHDAVRVRLGGIKRNVKSFSMPGVEVGSIVEYRWKEVREGADIIYLRLQFQDEFPIERATYFVIPWSQTTEKMSVVPYNCKPTPLKLENDGYTSTTLENVPAFREEPMMPGEPNVRPWALVSYHTDTNRNDPDKYWNEVGRKWYGRLKGGLKMNGDLKQIASQAVVGAKDDDEKAARLIGWIHANVRGLWSRQVSDQERAALFRKWPKDRVRTSTEVFKSGIGDTDELNTLFAALALQVGMDARPALIASRDGMVFDKRLVEEFFLPNVDMAISLGGKWKIYDVNAKLLPPGMLSWREEGVPALITDPKNPEFIMVPISAPEASVSTRKARLSLTEDGTLEGDVDESWTGHAAEEFRGDLTGEAADRQQQEAQERVVKAYPQAEVTALHVENADSPEKPLCLSYHIRIPAYAARTGKRILFQPIFFTHGDPPLFSAADRKYDVVFPYAWQEKDAVGVKLPAGFSLESPENPGSINFGPPGSYDLAMTVHNGTLITERNLTFGKGERIHIPRELYPQLKRIFDTIHSRDDVTLSLHQTPPTAAGAK